MDTQRLYDELYSDPAALAAYEALSAAGGRVYIVGGAVRDAAIGKKPKDIDLVVTDLSKHSIESALRSLNGSTTFAGKNFGVYHYHLGDYSVEIALPRRERSTGLGHKDFEVEANPNVSIEEDLGRRDFTANAMAFDIDSNRLVDPHNGEQDIQDGRLKLINKQAFKDDPLRIVRALVAYSVHGLEPDEFTLDEMQANAQQIKNLPHERIQMELDKLLSGNNPSGAFRLAYETGILQYILPELDSVYEFDQQSAYHDLLIGEHSLAVLDAVTELTTDKDVRLAALLHDIGKPDSFWQDEDGFGHFYETPDVDGSADHEDVGAVMAEEFMKRMNYPSDRIKRVVNLIQNHMFPYFSTEAGARKFIGQAGGLDEARDLLDLRQGDASGKNDGTIDPDEKLKLDNSRALVDSVEAKGQAFNRSKLAINGNDLMDIGIAPGPTMGLILNRVMDYVIENPDENNREALLKYVRENLI